MKTKVIKGILKLLIQVVVITCLLMGISIFTEGMYLIGVPSVEDVEKVTIVYPRVTEEVKSITDKEKIETAIQLTGFLKYNISKKVQKNDEPIITITYYKQNGEEISVSASNETVWWKGKAYTLKDDETFINLAEGIFFMEELVNN